MADRILYRQVEPYINGVAVNRSTSIGMGTNYSVEELRELGNAKEFLYKDLPSVDFTFEGYEYGSLKALSLFAGKAVDNKIINFTKDFDKHAEAEVWAYINEDNENYIQYGGNCALTSASYSYGIEGNYMESYGINGDSKAWFLNSATAIQVVTAGTLTYTDGVVTAGGTAGGTVYKVLSILLTDADGNAYRKDGSEVFPTGSHTGSTISVQFAFPVEPVSAKITVACGATKPSFTLDTVSDYVKRRGHVNVSLLWVEDFDGDTGELTLKENGVIPIGRVQSANVDVSPERENLYEVGRTRPYARPLVIPMNVTVNLETIFGGLNLFAALAGYAQDEISSINVIDTDEVCSESIGWSIGIRWDIHDVRDIESFEAGERNLVKRIEVPKLIPDNTNWNLTTTQNALHSMAFRAHDCVISVPDEE